MENLNVRQDYCLYVCVFLLIFLFGFFLSISFFFDLSESHVIIDFITFHIRG